MRIDDFGNVSSTSDLDTGRRSEEWSVKKG
jgi:hypothetical protein